MGSKRNAYWRWITVAAVIFVVGTGVFFLFNSTSESKKREQVLIDRFGPTEAYRPPPDGAFPQHRLEQFTRVRQAVQPNCTAYQEVMNGILGLAALESDEEPSGEDLTSAGMAGFKSIMRVGPELKRFMDARNTALLAEDMGIGEYMYLYIAAYGEQLSHASESPYAEMEEAYISKRTRREYRRMLEHQLESLGEEPGAEEREVLATHLKEAILMLQQDDQLSPWPEGAVGATERSLAPFRNQLDDLYCDGVASIELLQKNQGFRFGG